MKEKKRSIIFAGLLISISFLNMISPTKIFSDKENRYLEQFPKFNFKNILSGNFSNKFETYVTDQFIGRDHWIGLKTLSQLTILQKDNGRVYFGREDYLFDLSQGIDEQQFNINMDSINIFVEKMKEYNHNIVISTMLIPTKTEVLKDKLPLYADVVDEKEVVEKIKDKLEGIQIIDLIDPLKEHSDEYIYYRTDHHWTTNGAYYGYKEYMDWVGETASEKDQFTINKVSNNFYGTSYRKANFYNGEPDHIYTYIPNQRIDYHISHNNGAESEKLYDEGFLKKVDQYSYFLGGDTALIKIETSIKNNKTIVVMKDSFANSLIPFLMGHYNNIVVADTRYYNGSVSDLVKEFDADEILLLYNIQNFTNEKSFLRYRT